MNLFRNQKILIQKAKEGVEVRFIYDDFGSSSIRKNLVKRLRENGVNAFPFYKIKLIKFANRLNYTTIPALETNYFGEICT